MNRTRGTIRASVIGVLLGLAGCVLVPSNSADGSSCDEDDDCKSHRCFQGYCGGSECKGSGDDSACESGWKCTHYSADIISGLFGSHGSDQCAPTCGHCPPSMYCSKEAAAQAGSTCIVGKAPLDISIAPVTGIVGQPVHLVATIAQPTGSIADCTWQLGESTPVTGPAVEITHVYTQGQRYSIEVTCKDDGGRQGTARGEVDISCQHEGDACDPTLCCGDASGHGNARNLACLPSSGAPSATNTCHVPKVGTITVTGPTSTALDTSATYTAATDGDSPVESVTWRFDDDFVSTKSGVTIQHQFTKAGSITVRAEVRDKIGYTTTGQLSITVN